jgi:hypothetical protein
MTTASTALKLGNVYPLSDDSYDSYDLWLEKLGQLDLTGRSTNDYYEIINLWVNLNEERTASITGYGNGFDRLGKAYLGYFIKNHPEFKAIFDCFEDLVQASY